MKKVTLISVFLSVILLVSCNKENSEDLKVDSSFYALKDGSSWITTSYRAYYSKSAGNFALTGAKRDSVYYQEEWLHLSFSISDIGETGESTPFNSQWYYVVGGDAIADAFELDTTYQNQLVITALDTVNKHISGTFLVKLIGDSHHISQGETMLFRNGVFDLNYTDVE